LVAHDELEVAPDIIVDVADDGDADDGDAGAKKNDEDSVLV
jgi:hypothetical protein